MQILVSCIKKKNGVWGNFSSCIANSSLELSLSIPEFPSLLAWVYFFTAPLIPAFLLSQSLTLLQKRLKCVFCMFVVRLAEPFRQAKKSQPSRSEKRKASYALWIAVMVGETGRTGEKKCVCVCVCGNLCSASLDLPCCSGNEGKCSRSSKAG